MNVAERRRLESGGSSVTDHAIEVRTGFPDVDSLLGQQELESRELQLVILIISRHVSSTDPILYLFFIISSSSSAIPVSCVVIIDGRQQ